MVAFGRRVWTKTGLNHSKMPAPSSKSGAWIIIQFGRTQRWSSLRQPPSRSIGFNNNVYPNIANSSLGPVFGCRSIPHVPIAGRTNMTPKTAAIIRPAMPNFILPLFTNQTDYFSSIAARQHNISSHYFCLACGVRSSAGERHASAATRAGSVDGTTDGTRQHCKKPPASRPRPRRPLRADVGRRIDR